ncbi:transposase [Streptomyces sp. NPDC097610]|uniref:transposase n=1 Tax=Streptomyces sp. NPDC097610 TaxID=3157227 RepID=UPI00332E6DF5
MKEIGRGVFRILPGMGTVPEATFHATIGGDTEPFGSAVRLAALVGLPPAPCESGRVSANMRRSRSTCATSA